MTQKDKSGKDKGKPAKAKLPALKVAGGHGRAARNVEQIRTKLSAALDDPHQRDQIVAAMRRLINEDTDS